MKQLVPCIFLINSLTLMAQKPVGTKSVLSEKATWTTISREEYKIQSPINWAVDTSKKNGADVFLFSPQESISDKFRENINVLIQNLKGTNIDLDKYTKISETQIKEMAKDAVVIDSKRINKEAASFHKIIYKSTQQSFPLTFEQYYFIRNEKAYVITLTVETDKFISFQKTGEYILNSFTLLK